MNETINEIMDKVVYYQNHDYVTIIRTMIKYNVIKICQYDKATERNHCVTLPIKGYVQAYQVFKNMCDVFESSMGYEKTDTFEYSV